MKGQDIVLLCKSLVGGELIAGAMRKSLRDLSWELGMSLSEVHAGFRRLVSAGLAQPDRTPRRSAALEFLLHGFKYVFPAIPGGETVGMPTGLDAEPLQNAGNPFPRREPALWVWPWPEGSVRGAAVTPLFRSVPVAASRDPALHSWLAVLDALRVGRARERAFAREWLAARLEHAKS